MPKRETHLGAARAHGRRAFNELRHMTADSALHWILSHRGRVAQFRRAVRGTRAARPFEQLLKQVREQATALPRPVARKRKATLRRSGRRTRFIATPFMM
jgi:hypothetical protein